MKLRNAAPQWQSLPRDSYSRYWEIDDKRNNSRKAFRIAIWVWVLKRVSKEENTAKVRFDTRLSQKHVSVEMINAKLFWNAFTMCPRKKTQNPETMDKSCGMCYYRISRPNSRVFHSNSFSLHSNSTILVHCRISAVQIHYSGFQIYGFFIRINIFFIQIHWNSAIFTILSFNLALYGLVTS